MSSVSCDRYPIAMTNLGDRFFRGLGCEKDLKQAEAYLRHAAALGDSSAYGHLAKLQGEQGRGASAVASEWECAINMQVKQQGVVSDSHALEAFAHIVEEQEKRDKSANFDELCKQLAMLNIALPSFPVSDHQEISTRFLDKRHQQLVKLLHEHRPLTEAEERAISLLSDASGESMFVLGQFLRGRGKHERALKALELGAKLGPSLALWITELTLSPVRALGNYNGFERPCRRSDGLGLVFNSSLLQRAA